ncbi:MAG: DRTGG domain-containing protein [Oscillospiraceae bacterium]|nr:DRTGG domain-containing protein [Oscillospiraceae bacterium]
MTVEKLIEGGEFSLCTEDFKREITNVYCCDLLSVVMGSARADCAWVTVMGGVNSIAVAVLADMSCIVLAENMPLDDMAKSRAEQQGITILKTPLPVFEAAKRINDLL